MSDSLSVTTRLWRLRFTLGFLGVMIAANWAAGGLWRDLPAAALARWGISHDDLARGEVWRLITANFLSKHPRMLVDQIVFSLCIIGWFEWHHGSLRAFAMFFVTNTAGFLLTLFWVVGVLKSYAVGAGLDTMRDIGMSAGGFGLVGAIIADLPRKWLLLGGALVLLGAKFFVLPDPIADIAHPITLVLGFALERYLLSMVLHRHPRTGGQKR